MLTTRERLIEEAAVIFSEKGYTAATTREICHAADTNITSIHYHFKNKAGLYRAIFSEPLKTMPFPKLELNKLSERSRQQILAEFYRQLLQPFLDDIPKHMPKIHHLIHELIKREQFEPSGLVDDLIVLPVIHIHQPLNELLCSCLQLDTPDEELHRLAFVIVGIGFSMIHPRHIIKYYAPELVSGANWQDEMLSRLAFFADAMISAEIIRRQSG